MRAAWTQRMRAGLMASASVAWVACAMLAAATPAQADDLDTDFERELHTYGIYGPRDYQAWIGKLTCRRIDTHIDPTAEASAKFVYTNLPRSSRSEQQVYEFINTSINYYCPQNRPTIDNLAQ